MRKIWQNPIYRFLLIGFFLYIIWISLYEIFIVPNKEVHFVIGDFIATFVEVFMNILGKPTYTQHNSFQVIIGLTADPTVAVWIGEPCNGLKLFGLFSIFIAAYPSNKWIHKLWFIPAGILLIHIVNVLRVIGLILVFEHNPNWLDFNHDYTFTIIVYAFIFFLWWIFIKYFGKTFHEQKNP